MTHWPTNKTRKYFKYSLFLCSGSPLLWCEFHTHHRVTLCWKFTKNPQGCEFFKRRVLRSATVLVFSVFPSTFSLFLRKAEQKEIQNKMNSSEQQVKYILTLPLVILYDGGFWYLLLFIVGLINVFILIGRIDLRCAGGFWVIGYSALLFFS